MADGLQREMTLLLDSSPDFMAYLDAGGVYRFVNKKYTASLGKPREEIVGRTLAQVLGRENFCKVKSHLVSVLAGKRVSFKNDYVLENGRCISVSTRYTPDVDAEGRVVGFFVRTRDITAERAAQSLIRDSEERFHLLLEHIHAGVMVCDPDTRIRLVNEKACEMLSLPEERIVGKPAVSADWEFLRDDGSIIPAEEYVVSEVVRTRRSLTDRVMGFRRAGDSAVAWALVTAYPVFDESGVLRQVTVAALDITAHRQAEAQLRHAQKMEAVGRLATGLTHDFRNQLSVILGYAQILERRALVTEAGRSQLGEIVKAGERAVELTGRLMAFTRQEVLNPELKDLGDLVSGIAKTLPSLIGEDIRLSIRRCGEACVTRIDPAQFEQAVMNLVTNARDAMPLGGDLRIGTDRREVVMDPDLATGVYGVVEVSDTGVGMDAGTLARAFDPFFTTKESDRGTGLGLSMVYGFVHQCKGAVRVDSHAGKGTTFRLYFPLVEAPVKARRIPSSRVPVPGGTETILLVEDEEPLRVLLAGFLQEVGYDVVQARDGQDAVDCWLKRGSPIQMMVTDVVMPGMSGGELARRLREDAPDLPVVFITGYAGREVVLRDVDASEDILTKPFSRSDFLRKVRAALDREVRALS